MVSGIMMAISASDPSPGTGYKTMAAATVPVFETPKFEVPTLNSAVYKDGIVDLPEDLLRYLAEKKGVLDTVYVTKTDTIKEQVTKVKWKKVPVPNPMVERDTIREAHYYIATQVGTKEEPTGECVSIYEFREVDTICPETLNSSVKRTPQCDNDVGD